MLPDDDDRIGSVPLQTWAELATTYECIGGAPLVSTLASFTLNRYLFRGQARESWGLRPSIERLPEFAFIDSEGAEELVVRAFSRRATIT